MKVSRRSNPERREQSREKILDAAESLFAQGGFNGVSLKDIARAADVDTSLLHYYFVTKAGLFAAVLERRSEDVNRVRSQSMSDYAAAAGDQLTIRGLLQAYLQPTFDFIRSGGPSLQNYLVIIAQMNSTPAGQIAGTDVSPFDPVVQEFIRLLARARPDRSEAELYWFYHMLSGAIGLSWAQTGRIDQLSGGQCRSDDFEAICNQMVSVFANGLDRPAMVR